MKEAHYKDLTCENCGVTQRCCVVNLVLKPYYCLECTQKMREENERNNT